MPRRKRPGRLLVISAVEIEAGGISISHQGWVSMRRLAFDLFIFFALAFVAYRMYVTNADRVFFVSTVMVAAFWTLLKAYVYLRLRKLDS